MIRLLSLIKFSIKNSIAYFLYYTGILFLIKKYRLKNKAVVLTYHRVMPEEIENTSFSTKGIIVRPDTFNRHMTFIKKHFSVKDITKFNDDFLQNNIPDKPSCLVTFDDGWIDNYLYAFPILKTHAIPALIFLPIDYIETKNLFWQEKLSRSLFHLLNLNSDSSNKFLHKHNMEDWITLAEKARKQKIQVFISKMKEKPYSDVDDLFKQISEIKDNNTNIDHIDRYFEWNHVMEMQKSSVSFGSHACTHRILTRLNKEEIQEELTKSANKLKEFMGNTPLTIAYPNGNSDESVQSIASDIGYTLGFGTKSGHVTSADNPFDIQRVNIHEGKTQNNPLLMMAILGLY